MAKTWLFLLAIATLVGCASAPSASPEMDAAAKKFVPPDGKANLYIGRGFNSFGSAVTFKVSVDGSPIGAIAQGRFFLVSLSPGDHQVTAASAINAAKVSLSAEAGKNYFYEVAVNGGGIATASLSLVLLEEMGKLMIRQEKLAPSSGQ